MSILSRIGARYRQFKHAKERDGLGQAVKSAARYVVQNPKRSLFFRTGTYQTSERIDMDERWEIMREHIADDARNALDIGCNQGGISRRAADRGLFTIGIDQSEILLDDARRMTASDQSCYFLRSMVNPENVAKLPSFDVTFLLTVYYHWGDSYGWEEAESMLRTVAAKTGTLIYQTPKSDSYVDSPVMQQYSDRPLIEMHVAYLQDVLQDCTVKHVGTTDYVGDDRKDAIFVIQAEAE